MPNLFKGHSGCKIELDSKGRVHKTCPTHYNDRLFRQAAKQMEFKPIGNFRAAKVTNVGHGYLTMNYEPYKNFDDFLQFSGKKELDFIGESLVYYIRTQCKKNRKRVSSKIIQNKYQKVSNQIFRRWGILVSELNFHFYDLPEYLYLITGHCHGDMTFSNILFDKSEMVLIDFLDTYLENPIQDYVKLRQDTKHKWSLNFSNVQNKTKIELALTYIDNMLKEELHTNFQEYYKEFQLLNLLRIIPYAKNKSVVDYLMKEIRLLCQH